MAKKTSKARRWVFVISVMAIVSSFGQSVVAAPNGAELFGGSNGYVIGKTRFKQGGSVPFNLETIVKASSTIRNGDFGIYSYDAVYNEWINIVEDPNQPLSQDVVDLLEFDTFEYIDELPDGPSKPDGGLVVEGRADHGGFDGVTWTLGSDAPDANLVLDGWTVVRLIGSYENDTVTGEDSNTITVSAGSGSFIAAAKVEDNNKNVAYIGIEKLDDQNKAVFRTQLSSSAVKVNGQTTGSVTVSYNTDTDKADVKVSLGTGITKENGALDKILAEVNSYITAGTSTAEQFKVKGITVKGITYSSALNKADIIDAIIEQVGNNPENVSSPQEIPVHLSVEAADGSTFTLPLTITVTIGD